MKGYVIDQIDRSTVPKITSLGMKVLATNTLMDSMEAKTKLARETINFAETLA